MKYSYHNEQEIILNFFNGRIGRYLDLGAFDGVIHSNTLALAELGWQGTAVEPSPWVFKRLKDNYEKRNLTSSVNLIEAAAVPNNYPDQLKFYETHKRYNPEPGTGVGSLSLEHSRDWAIKAEAVKIVETTVTTITVEELFINSNYNFISIDVEDFNLEILVSLPWDKMLSVEMICVEADLPYHRFVNFMKPLGWKFHVLEHANLFFIRA